ncbi:hypothetical protein DM02DRAFT_633369 [Periconia macrospinosa]|uniref:Uncharacterized protein n=1 Tax=Periconia macrospinosa TaxID=97972 RepID=A0A2V1DCA8_9PLEO|nr:hypothetical protein DM02DRAFT_633369 [Periconia macrospinosa]
MSSPQTVQAGPAYNDVDRTFEVQSPFTESDTSELSSELSSIIEDFSSDISMQEGEMQVEVLSPVAESDSSELSSIIDFSSDISAQEGEIEVEVQSPEVAESDSSELSSVMEDFSPDISAPEETAHTILEGEESMMMDRSDIPNQDEMATTNTGFTNGMETLNFELPAVPALPNLPHGMKPPGLACEPNNLVLGASGVIATCSTCCEFQREIARMMLETPHEASKLQDERQRFFAHLCEH